MMKKMLVFAVVVTLGCGVYFGKLHRTRECIVTYVNDDNLTIRVQHPNGLEYGCNVDCTENYDVGETIKVSFNEMTDWAKYFSIVDIEKPYEQQ